MENDYDRWNTHKKHINLENRPFFQEREIWWCKIGKNIGDEENGKGDKFLRPVLIFRKFNRNIFTGIPLTSKIKTNPYHLKLENHPSCLLLSQIKTIDSKRLFYLKSKISTQEMFIIKQKIKDILNL